MKIIVLILILIFSYNLIFAQNCGTTSCASHRNLSDKDYKKVLGKVDAVFYGEIISQSDIFWLQNGFPYRILKVKVSRTWKGVEKSEIEIKYLYFDNDCAIFGESGRRIFYASLSEEPLAFHTGQCSKWSFNDKQTKHILGEGKIIEE